MKLRTVLQKVACWLGTLLGDEPPRECPCPAYDPKQDDTDPIPLMTRSGSSSRYD